MGFRPDLELGTIISQYDEWLGDSTAGTHYVRTEAPQRDILDIEEIPDELFPSQAEIKDDPVRIGDPRAPETFSTCTMLAVSPEICWDVNGYYRTLGVHWKATRRELMRGYQKVDGQASVYVTYVFSQLLNKEIRRAYDLTPLGALFLQDKYVQEELKRIAAKEAAKRTSATGSAVSVDQVMDEMGYDLKRGADDETASDKKMSEARRKVLLEEWLWAYFVWRSHKDDADTLKAWQQLLVSACSRRGVTPRIAVGFMGRNPRPFAIGEIGSAGRESHCFVVYLSQTETPTEEMADRAVDQLIDIQTKSFTSSTSSTQNSEIPK